MRDAAFAAGVAGWLRAIPELESRGRRPLVDGRPEAVAVLAARALTRLRKARAAKRDLPRKAAPALLPGWQADWILQTAAAHPTRVAGGDLHAPEYRRRGTLLLRSLTGRW